MLSYTRPDPDSAFASESAQLLDQVRAAIHARGGMPQCSDFKSREIWSGTWKRGKNPRGHHKAKLIGSSWFSKCSYCERILPPGREIDVEHYRPKVRISEWVGVPSIVSDAPPPEVDVGPGYWWLGFDWDNYLLSCKTCNQGWKRNIFPVVPVRAACVEGVEHTEQPLLINPASAFRPRDHFRWTYGGLMEPVSDQGYATIVTCGLNRMDLRVRRGKVVTDVAQALSVLKCALRCGDTVGQRNAFGEIARLGSRTEEFTSMSRWFVEECLGHAWDELEGMPH